MSLQSLLQDQIWKRDDGLYMLFFETRYFVMKLKKKFFILKSWTIEESGKISYDEQKSCIVTKYGYIWKVITVSFNYKVAHCELRVCDHATPKYERFDLLPVDMKVTFPKINTIHDAAFFGMLGVVENFLENGVDIDIQSVDEENPMPLEFTPLHTAVKGNATEVFDYLLEQKANIHIKDYAGLKVLHRALDESDTYMVQRLLDLGALESFDTDDKAYIMHYAISFGACDEAIIALYRELLKDPEMLKNLQKTSANILSFTFRTEPVGCLLEQRVKLFEFLLTFDLDFEKKNHDGLTALLAAAEGGAVDLVKMYVKKGVDIHAVDRKGRNIADYAQLIEDPNGVGLVDEFKAYVATLDVKPLLEQSR